MLEAKRLRPLRVRPIPKFDALVSIQQPKMRTGLFRGAVHAGGVEMRHNLIKVHDV